MTKYAIGFPLNNAEEMKGVKRNKRSERQMGFDHNKSQGDRARCWMSEGREYMIWTLFCFVELNSEQELKLYLAEHQHASVLFYRQLQVLYPRLMHTPKLCAMTCG